MARRDSQTERSQIIKNPAGISADLWGAVWFLPNTLWSLWDSLYWSLSDVSWALGGPDPDPGSGAGAAGGAAEAVQMVSKQMLKM